LTVAAIGAPKKPGGEARTLTSTPETKRGVRTGYFLARYRDLEGHKRQAGRFKRKGDANKASLEKVNELNALCTTSSAAHMAPGAGPSPSAVLTLARWHEIWPTRVRRDQRTISTNEHRISKYIIPHLPEQGRIPIVDLNRGMLHDVQVALLQAGYAKRTIDGALSSLSAVLGYAMDEERIEANVAYRMRVDADDPLLNPTREQHERRYIPPDEFAQFFKYVKPQHRAACLAPLATGCRTQELFGLERSDYDRKQQLVFAHHRAPVYGGDPEDEATFRPGLKTTKGVRTKPKEKRGRWTLCPAVLFSVGPVRLHRRLLFPSPRGRVWAQRNFYRDAWDPASEKAGTEFTVYDLRHTFISHLLANGIPTVEVAAYAGHSTQQLGDIDNTTTRIYQHPTGDYREAALEAIGGYLAQIDAQKLASAQ
jgi:integrase